MMRPADMLSVKDMEAFSVDEFAWHISEQQQNLIQLADTKATLLLTAVPAFTFFSITTIAPGLPMLTSWERALVTIMLTEALLTFMVSMFFALMTITPRSSKQPNRYSTDPDKAQEFVGRIFHGDIVRLGSDGFATFAQPFREAHFDTLLDELLVTIWRVAHVAHAKYATLNRAIRYSLFSVSGTVGAWTIYGISLYLRQFLQR